MVKPSNIRITITIPRHTHTKLIAFAKKAKTTESRIISSMLKMKMEQFLDYTDYTDEQIRELRAIAQTRWLDDE